MLPLHVICSVLFLVAILTNVCWIRCRPVPLQQGLAEHPYFKIMMLAYAASTVSCLAKAAHYGKFMQDGYGSNRLRLLGVVSAIVANSTIFIIAMMVSKGWAIGNFSFSNRSIFLSLIAIMGSLSAICELYAEANLDESTTVYSYQSPGGVAACVLKIFFFCWFSHEIKGTHDEEMDRKPKQFYKVFGLAFSIWFASVPITVLLAYMLNPWDQFKIVTAVELVGRLSGQVLISFLLLVPGSPLAAQLPVTAARRYPVGDYDFGELTNSLGKDNY